MATFFVRLIFTDKDGHNRVAQNISVDNHGNYVSADAWGAEYYQIINNIKQIQI